MDGRIVVRQFFEQKRFMKLGGGMVVGIRGNMLIGSILPRGLPLLVWANSNQAYLVHLALFFGGPLVRSAFISCRSDEGRLLIVAR